MDRVSPESEESYTPSEAARILRRSKRRVIQLITEGKLEGEKDEAGRWHIPKRAVHGMLSERSSRDLDLSDEPEIELVRELETQIADLNYRLGRAETRAELTELTESTLREQLERERERADRLEAELLAERRKSFWRRLFGGGTSVLYVAILLGFTVYFFPHSLIISPF